MIFNLGIILTLIPISLCLKVTVNTSKEMWDFFSTAYVKKAGGRYGGPGKGYLVPGFNPSWEVYHLHHVCVRGGMDGIFAGFFKQDNEWGKTIKDYQIISEANWNLKQTKIRNEPISIRRLKKSDENFNVTMVDDTSFFVNCFRQKFHSSNPAHWLMKLGQIYELSLLLSNHSVSDVFVDKINFPFKHMMFHQCPDPFGFGWKWGSNLWMIVQRRLEQVIGG